MKRFKSHFVFNRSERNGIFILVFLILILQGIYLFVDFSPEVVIPKEKEEEMARFQFQIDSLKKMVAAKDSFRIYPFNPNFISDYKGYTLGMSVEEIDRLHAFRGSDNWINSSAEFQKVTGISDSLLEKIAPYFKFPEWRDEEEPTSERTQKERSLEEDSKGGGTVYSVQDLNAASAEALMRVKGVGEVLSKRIVKYRESIGGFRDVVQLNDVYGLSPEVVERISTSFKILKTPDWKKQDLNSISVLGLSEIPGFTYELAREVIEYRNEKKGFQSFDELANIKGFPAEKIGRIQLYLTLD